MVDSTDIVVEVPLFYLVKITKLEFNLVQFKNKAINTTRQPCYKKCYVQKRKTSGKIETHGDPG